MKYVNAVIGTARADSITLFRYKKSLFSDIIIFLAVYAGIIVLGPKANLTNFYHVKADDGPALLLIGYIFWSFSNIALGYSSSIIASDAKSGLLEIKLQGILPYPIICFITAIVTLVESLIILFIVCIFSVMLNYITLTSLGYIFVSVLLTLPSIIGMYGIGLIIGSFAIKEKNNGQFVSIISAVLLFCSNTLFVGLPNYIYIIPFTLGIDISRELLTKNIFNVKWFIMYLIICIVWLMIGLATFNTLLKKEQLKGNFDTF